MTNYSTAEIALALYSATEFLIEGPYPLESERRGDRNVVSLEGYSIGNIGEISQFAQIWKRVAAVLIDESVVEIGWIGGAPDGRGENFTMTLSTDTQLFEVEIFDDHSKGEHEMTSIREIITYTSKTLENLLETAETFEHVDENGKLVSKNKDEYECFMDFVGNSSYKFGKIFILLSNGDKVQANWETILSPDPYSNGALVYAAGHQFFKSIATYDSHCEMMEFSDLKEVREVEKTIVVKTYVSVD